MSFLDFIPDIAKEIIELPLKWLESLWKTAREGVSWFWATVAAALAALVQHVFTVVSDMLDSIKTIITDVAIPALNLPPIASEVYSIANTFLPLTECITFTSAYFVFLAALTAYRLIKSWIPTLS